MTLKIALVGAGNMGRIHLRVLKDIPEVDLVGIADPDVESAKSVASKFDLAVYADYQKMLDEKNPQAVVIATPTCFHKEIALAAINRGIHVLVEKPIAGSVEDGEAMIEAAEKAKVVLAVGHIERFNPAVLELKRHIENGELGRVFMIHSRRQSPFPKRITDVGVACDLATHELDMMRYLAGSNVIHLSAEASQVLTHAPLEDIVFGLLRFENGVLGILDVNWVTPTTVRELTITGERGMFVVNYLSQELFFFENPSMANAIIGSTWDFSVTAGNMTRYQIVKKEPMRSQLDAFVDAVKNNKRPVVNGQDGLEALKLALQIAATLKTENKTI